MPGGGGGGGGGGGWGQGLGGLQFSKRLDFGGSILECTKCEGSRNMKYGPKIKYIFVLGFPLSFY